MGHTTDHLIGLAEQLQSNPDPRELELVHRHCHCQTLTLSGRKDVSRVLEIFEDAQTCLNLKGVRVEKDLRKVTIVSSELASSHEVDAILQLTRIRIPISIVISAPHSLSLLIPSDKSEEALQLLHGNVCLLKLVS